MGNAFIVRRGGSGGMREPFAVIYAHYPASAVCTCTDGSVTLTAPAGAGGETVFLLPNAGTWTVTAAASGLSDSRTFSVTRQFQTEYANLAVLYLFKNGAVVPGVSWNLAGNDANALSRVEIDSGGMHFMEGGGQYLTGNFQSAEKINFGSTPRFNRLVARYGAVQGFVGSTRRRSVGLGTSYHVGVDTSVYYPFAETFMSYYTAEEAGNGSPAADVILDVSAVTGEYYVNVNVRALALWCTDVWLE